MRATTSPTKTAPAFPSDAYDEALGRPDTWTEEEDDATSPSHYDIFGGEYQVLHLMADRLGDGFAPYLEGNVMKYLLRWRHKNGVEDLKKALRYLSWLVEYLDEDFDMAVFHEPRKWEQ